VRLANADNVFVICLGASLQLFLLCGFVGWLLHSGRIPNDTAPVLSKVQSPISPVRISPVRAKSTTRKKVPDHVLACLQSVSENKTTGRAVQLVLGAAHLQLADILTVCTV